MDYFKIVLLLCWTVLLAGFIQGIFFPANRVKTNSHRQVSQLNTGGKVLWWVTQAVYLVVLKVVIALLLTKLGYKISDDFIIPGPALILNVWLSHYLIHKRGVTINRFLMGLLLLICQIFFGLLIEPVI
jgi:hypothetical protein